MSSQAKKQYFFNALADLDYPHEIENLHFDFVTVRAAPNDKLVRVLNRREIEFSQKFAAQVLENTADYLTAMSLDVKRPYNTSLEHDRPTTSYSPCLDCVHYSGLYPLVNGKTSFHEVLHKYQVREWLGDFESDGGRKEAFEKFSEHTNEELRAFFHNSFQLKNNQGFFNYIFLLALDRSPELVALLRKTKEAYENYFDNPGKARDKADKFLEEFSRVVKSEGLDEYPLHAPMEAFGAIADMFFVAKLEDEGKRDYWADGKSKGGDDEMIGEWMRQLYRMYDSYSGSREEKFKQVMKVQKGLFDSEKPELLQDLIIEGE
ncbi:hypothetical protein KGY79_09320 [Candidatus Bipolaricaulota bacterium]|nr:hypothetical protein [Candidatus Bipolaricaulota bacterium]